MSGPRLSPESFSLKEMSRGTEMEVREDSGPACGIETGLGSLKEFPFRRVGSTFPAFLGRPWPKLGGSSWAAPTVSVDTLTPFPPYPGLLPTQHPEEHGVYVSPRQELHHQQGDPEPVPVLPAAEMLRSWHVQGV